MCNDDELALVHETVQDFDKTADIRFVERGIHFVQHAERAGLHHVNGEEEGDRCHGAFAAGEKRNALKLLARRFGDDLDATFKRVAFVDRA